MNRVDLLGSLERHVHCLCAEEPITQLHTNHLRINIWRTHMLL